MRSVTLLLAALHVALAPTVPGAKAQAPGLRHVLVIVGDDHAVRALGCYGDPHVRTPHLDRLAARGTRFTRAYANAPLCSASRASLLTGAYPHATGVNLLFTPFDDARNRTLAEHFGEAGYRTALLGKRHWNEWIWAPLYADGPPRFGFDVVADRPEYRAWLAARSPGSLPPDLATYPPTDAPPPPRLRWNADALPQPYRAVDSEAGFLAESAVGFLRDCAAAGRPSLTWLAFHEPHAPFAFPVEAAADLPGVPAAPPPVGSEDTAHVPAVFAGLTPDERLGIRRAYYASVEHLDRQVGRVLDSLEAAGLLAETLVAYLGDQGYLLGEHGRFEKHTLWEEAVRVPLLLAGPGIARGREVDDLVELVDLAPTLCELAGLPPLLTAQGRSFAAVLGGSPPEHPHREAAFATYLEDNKAMIATRRWKYVFATGKRDLGQGYATGRPARGLEERLYDLRDDPGETRDVAREYPRTVDSLRRVALRRFAVTHPDADALPPYLDERGRMAWFCEPRDVGADFGGEPLRVSVRPSPR